MSVRTTYANGEPCWADLQTPDVAAAKDFYNGLFGWTYQDFPTPDGRSYAQAFVRGQLVATIAPQSPLQLQAGTSAKWNVYFSAGDTGDLLAEAGYAGGTAQFGPEQVGDAGVLGFLAPPGGGTTGIWQAGSHYGSHLFNEPGALAWAELITPEPHAAVGFFQQLFGHEVTEYPQDDGGSYSTLLIDGSEVAGVVPADEGEEADWQVYYGVADVAAAAAAAQAAGGQVVVEPDDHPADGSLATIKDPQGGVLNLIQVA
ncbi:VOC family protein [Pseudarthrobacter sp. Fe7]|nr:VOC family protein [Pseudarthrobacter sp. Fe7]